MDKRLWLCTRTPPARRVRTPDSERAKTRGPRSRSLRTVGTRARRVGDNRDHSRCARAPRRTASRRARERLRAGRSVLAAFGRTTAGSGRRGRTRGPTKAAPRSQTRRARPSNEHDTRHGERPGIMGSMSARPDGPDAIVQLADGSRSRCLAVCCRCATWLFASCREATAP